MKIFKYLLRRIILSAFLLYLYNFLFIKELFAIPINFANITLVTFLGYIGIIGLIIFKILIL